MTFEGGRALPDFPWDSLVPYRERAAAHPDGLVDLSVGTPVDATPPIVRAALAAAADAPGYPATYGTAPLRTAVVDWLSRRFGIGGIDPAGVLPTIGSKELVAWLPTLLGLGERDVVVHPELAYPTYDVGARLAGATPVAADSLTALGPRRVSLLWLNSPANPHGRVLPVKHLAKVVSWARERGVVVASDECYLEFGWAERPVSVLDPEVNGGSLESILAVHSLSKRSNLAGVRVGFYAGDPELVRYLSEVRKHAGFMVPGPVQAAAVVALDDDEHVELQRERYRRRLELLRAALAEAGVDCPPPAGTFYLWVPAPGGDAWGLARWLARTAGAVVSPGEFYGEAGAGHVRVAVVQPDDQLALVAQRLAGAPAPSGDVPDAGGPHGETA